MENQQPQKHFIIECHVNDRDVMIPICEELKKQKHYFIVSLHSGRKGTTLKKVSKKIFEKIIKE